MSGALKEGKWLHNTRHGPQQAAPGLALIEASWLYRAVAGYRRLPGDLVALLRGRDRDQASKGKIRKWVFQNVI